MSMNRNAFTLVEILIVVAIIAILSAFAVPMIAAYRQTVQENSCKATMHRIERAVEAFVARENRYPDTMDDLSGNERRFFKDTPICPFGHTAYLLSSDSESVVVTCQSHDDKLHNVNKSKKSE